MGVGSWRSDLNMCVTGTLVEIFLAPENKDCLISFVSI